MSPAPRPPAPRVMRLEITVLEALFGGERRVDAGEGRLVDLRMPAGLRAGETLRLKPQAEGEEPTHLTIAIAVDAGWQVRGHDVCLTVEAPAEALRPGARLEIDTPRGPRVLAAPDGVQDGGIVRIRGEGLPARGRHPAGDLLIRLARAGEPPRPEEEAGARSLLRRFTARWAA